MIEKCLDVRERPLIFPFSGLVLFPCVIIHKESYGAP